MGMSLICRGVVMDMDGTFFIGESLLPGALELLRLLNERDIPFSFLTNNTSRGRQDYVQKLTRLGVAPQDARIYPAGDATISYLKATYPGKKVFLMGTRSLAESFLESGIPDRSRKLHCRRRTSYRSRYCPGSRKLPVCSTRFNPRIARFDE